MKPKFPYVLLALVLLVTGVARLPFATHAQAGAPAGATIAATPPMGWNSWNYFHRNVADAIVRAQADAMVSSGMKAAGYTYVNIDDTWEGARDANGYIQPNEKFPDMKALSDYVHGKGLKLGIYSSPGPKTCAGFEGSYQHERQDAEQYARWGIDYLKYDWCSARQVYKDEEMQAVYKKMGDALRATGRPIVYSLCQYGEQRVWGWAPSIGGNLWRTTLDIEDHFDRIMFIGLGQNGLEKYAAPGHWNDPDMLEVGNGKLSNDENRAHMTLWCVLAAPLIAGNDLTHMSRATLAILTNPEVIAVDQDRAGVQGREIYQEGALSIWDKPLKDGSHAVALMNTGHGDEVITLNFIDIGIARTKDVHVRDLWDRVDLGTFREQYASRVRKHGTMLLHVW